MGKRGPKPKPTGLRILEGNPSRRPINEAEPVATGEPPIPEHLSDDAQQIWRQIMDSVPPGMISAADAPLLAAYCEAWSTHKQAAIQLRKERDLMGPTLIRDGKPSPYVKIMSDAARTMATLATRLGLSPADRSGLKMGERKPESSRWAGLIK
ncbi:MAG: phage terminase small subunit P27 family [Alphaproteobacteria bacterium]